MPEIIILSKGKKERGHIVWFHWYKTLENAN